jgi:nitroreductase
MRLLYKLRLKQHIIRNLIRVFFYDAKRFYKYATQVELNEYSEKRLIGYIIAKYHIIEKGLSMPEMRPGFGKQALEAVINSCEIFYSKYGNANCQVNYAVDVLAEYVKVHNELNYVLDENINKRIKKLQMQNTQSCTTNNATLYNASEYFSACNSVFPKFAKSRHSMRNFSDADVNIEDINAAIDLCQETTPTSCNRQSIRVYVVSDKELIKKVLSIQTGNRGFGHLTNKLIVLTAEVSVYNEVRERNLSYIDSGIYAMNLMYSLHYHEIASVPLNWSANINDDLALRSLLKVPESEIVMLVLSCGKPADEFKLAKSKRYKYNDVTRYF